jgi:DNA-binding transcriptional regulator YiaG
MKWTGADLRNWRCRQPRVGVPMGSGRHGEHLSQRALAEWLKISLRTLKRWEKGDSPIPFKVQRKLTRLAQQPS